ncbi:MAG: dual specificity protein phosphatase family protein [Lysinibacillus sp.]
MEKNYHALVDGRIYIGGAEDVPSVLENEQINLVIDLRGEANVLHEKAIHLPIVEGIKGQDESVYRAIDQVVSAYHEGKNIYFHCKGGSNRTGAVATATLLELGKAANLEEAVKMAKTIREKINVRDELMRVLEEKYQ